MTDREKFIARCSFQRDGKAELLQWLQASDFFTAPASTKYHGAFEGGLCAHSLTVYGQLCRLCAAYPELDIPEDSKIIVALFHDLCKVNAYSVEKRYRKDAEGKWETYDAFVANEKVHFGGHGSKSVFILQSFIKLTVEEAVAINCHMGGWDGEKSVAEAFKQFPLAWLLHVADESATFIIEKDASV